MNYRHSYHAGNFADVLKHAVLAQIITYLKRKDQAFRVIDTHAGIGVYDLSSVEAQKTGEWREGVGRVMKASLSPDLGAFLAPWLETVTTLNPEGGLRHYPGSPKLARLLMRKKDRLSAIELHPADAEKLRAAFEGDYQVRVIELDGWLALGAHVPPKEKRGLVVVDPPFEREGEFDRIVDGLAKAYRRWPGGIYALWYPIKDYAAVARFRDRLRSAGIARILDVSLSVRGPSPEPRLDGSGLVVVNPPFLLEEEMQTILPTLAVLLAEDETASWRIEHLAGEDAARRD